MKFTSLFDIQSHNIITIDADSLTLRLEIDSTVSEVRLKAYHAEILYALFSSHPKPLSYETLVQHMKEHRLIANDSTRIHRKLSELRNALIKFHPSLGSLIQNTRGIGYSLPLSLRHVYATDHDMKMTFRNNKITESLAIINELIEDVIKLTSENKIVKHSIGFVINRNACKEILAHKITVFNNVSDIILTEIRSHEADILGIRIAYYLAKLRTYIGLARVSEYSISESQWLDWFKQEVWMLFDDLKKMIKEIEGQ